MLAVEHDFEFTLPLTFFLVWLAADATINTMCMILRNLFRKYIAPESNHLEYMQGSIV